VFLQDAAISNFFTVVVAAPASGVPITGAMGENGFVMIGAYGTSRRLHQFQCADAVVPSVC